MNLRNSKDYLVKYPYIDNQNAWYSEFPEATFNKILSNKKFTIKKNGTVVQNLETWINNISALQKPKSTLKIISLIKKKDATHEMLIHRNGRNHGIIVHLEQVETNIEIILNDIKVVGVKNEYELAIDKPIGVTKVSFGDSELRYNNLEDMWLITDEEKLT
jgi:hypothetical protein